jgi:uncharacterized protein
LIDARIIAKREEILRVASKHGAYNVRIFGSAARGEARSDSDIDIIVTMERGRSFLDLVSLSQELEDLLGTEVDVLTDGGVSPYIEGKIYSEAVSL